jgi:hypothetical protein
MLHDWDPADADAFNDELNRFATSFEAAKDQIRSMTFPPRTTLTSSGAPLPATSNKEQ